MAEKKISTKRPAKKPVKTPAFLPFMKPKDETVINNKLGTILPKEI